MKKQQRAPIASSKVSKVSRAEYYGNLARAFLKKEKDHILELNELRAEIEEQTGRFPKRAYFISIINAPNSGLGMEMKGDFVFVFLKPEGKEKKSPKARRAKRTETPKDPAAPAPEPPPARPKKAAKGAVSPKAMKATKSDKKLSPEEFVLQAIRDLRKPPYKGIHTVISGFNAAFRDYFSGLDPVKEVNKLVAAGKVQRMFVRKGAMLYFPGEAPATHEVTEKQGKKALKKMGLKTE